MIERGSLQRRRWVVELSGFVAAGLIALIVVTHLLGSDRVWLLLSDGDSVLTVLVASSLESGQAQNWAMSSVLFIPEIAIFVVLTWLGLPVIAALLSNAVLTLVAIYAAIRFVFGRGSGAFAPVFASLAAFSVFAGFALLESSSSRESLELASLTATTTYYYATVIAVIISVGLVRRLLSGTTPRWRDVVVLLVVAAVSTLSNPLFLAWAVVPFLAVIAVLAMAGLVSLRTGAMAAVPLVAGAVLGLLARVPFADTITNSGMGYAQPERWLESLFYYSELVHERAQSWPGLLELCVLVALIVAAIVVTIAAVRRGALRVATIALMAWLVPVLVVLGAIALGTHAARYLQPAIFLPVLVVGVFSAREPLRRAAIALGSAIVAVLAFVAALGIPTIASVAADEYPDSSVACVVDWVEASGRTGAGQFWSVRAPKAYLDDPSRLVQVDATLNSYAWIVNRVDYESAAVTFLVTDAQSAAFSLPEGVSIDDAMLYSCGRFTIIDFGDRVLPLGPEHS